MIQNSSRSNLKENQNSTEVKCAYAYCESVTRRHAKSFYFAAKFLPKHKQKFVYAIYALCRHIDDEVDEIGVDSERKAVDAIEKWKANLDEVFFNAEAQRRRGAKSEPPAVAGGLIGSAETRRCGNAKSQNPQSVDRKPKTESQNFVLFAWKDLLKTYKIPQNLPLELMQGVLMDTHTKRYETFDELYVYCYRVASTVGLMSSEILGYSDKIALEYAEALGIAMQLTNILRDVKEDAAMGRIYLPQEDLRKFRISEEQIFANETNENFIEMMSFQIERARNYYLKAEKGIALLEKDTRFTVLLASRLYSKILDEIEKQNYNVFSKRAHINFRQKVFSIPNIWIQARSL